MTIGFSISAAPCQTSGVPVLFEQTALRTRRERPQKIHMAADNDDKTALNARMQLRLSAVAQSGDVAAFEELFRHYGPRIRAYMARLARDGQLAEELMQETMMAVWRKSAQYSPEKGNVSTWIFTIARNLRIDWYRKTSRPEFDPNDPAFVSEGVEPADAALEGAQDADRLHAAMAKLPPEQFQLLKLSFFDEASHGTIAETLGIPLGTVKSRIRLAFAKLRIALESSR